MNRTGARSMATANEPASCFAWSHKRGVHGGLPAAIDTHHAHYIWLLKRLLLLLLRLLQAQLHGRALTLPRRPLRIGKLLPKVVYH